MLDRADLIAVRAERKLDELDRLTRQSQELLDDGRQVTGSGRELTAAGEGTVESAQEQLTRLRRLLDRYQPALDELAPLVSEAAGALRPLHLHGLIGLLDQLPHLVDRFEPALEGMSAMVPHLDEVTDRVDTVSQVVEGLPGAKLAPPSRSGARGRPGLIGVTGRPRASDVSALRA